MRLISDRGKVETSRKFREIFYFLEKRHIRRKSFLPAYLVFLGTLSRKILKHWAMSSNQHKRRSSMEPRSQDYSLTSRNCQCFNSAVLNNNRPRSKWATIAYIAITCRQKRWHIPPKLSTSSIPNEYTLCCLHWTHQNSYLQMSPQTPQALDVCTQISHHQFDATYSNPNSSFSP